MFGRRKVRAAREVSIDGAGSAEFVETAPVNTVPGDDVADDAATFTRTQVSLDETFLAMMAQLDDSLTAMARACDRIEDAVAGASRHQSSMGHASAA